MKPSGKTIPPNARKATHGAWRNADGVQRGEPSKVVVVVHPDDQASEAAITRVIATYKQSFRQESVLREHAGVCVRPYRRIFFTIVQAMPRKAVKEFPKPLRASLRNVSMPRLPRLDLPDTAQVFAVSSRPARKLPYARPSMV